MHRVKKNFQNLVVSSVFIIFTHHVLNTFTMSEPILIALVQLFAIVAASKHERLSTNARLIIETYLKQYISGQELEEYLLLYDELFSFHEMMNEETGWANKETLNKINDLCTKISTGLQQKDKVIIFIKFIEFIEEIKNASDNYIESEKKEFEYYQTIKQALNLTNNEFDCICSFILNVNPHCIEKDKILVIADVKHEKTATLNTIIRNRFNGYIKVLHLESVDLLIGNYSGTDDLYLNGHYIYPKQTFILNHGSILKSQKTNPIYYTDVASKLLYKHKSINLQFNVQDIAYKFKNSENGVRPISFSANSGELIGVMGGSGTGKSTLLNLLNGSLKPAQGNIYINGHDLSTENKQLKSIIGYIPQDDLLIDELTVFQNLYYNARLCYSNLSSFRITRIVLKVLQDVDLMEIRDLIVGNPLNKVISGGQRKRLNIALELIREPFILFADEPTSGLSSLDSEMVMLLLKEQTIKGKLAMVNIHQPSSNIFKLFDKLLILDKGGYPIFYGNPIDSITYFKSERKHVNPTESECLSCGYVNPEQLFQITEAKTINKHGKVTNQRVSAPAEWYKTFQNKIQPNLKVKVKNNAIPENNFKIPNLVRQFKIFSIRNLIIKLTNRQYVLLNLLEAPILAVILAFLTRYSTSEPYIFGDNNNLVSYLFMSIVVALFLGMMVSAEEIIKDRKLLKREAFLNLSRFSYLNSKIAFLFTLSAIQTLLYVLVGNLILRLDHLTFSYWMVLFSTSCFANMVGLNLSAGMNSVVTIYISIPFFLVPQILLSGVIVPFDTLNRSISANKNVPIIGDLMASRWAFEAMAVNEIKNNPYSKHFFIYDQEVANINFTKNYWLPEVKSKLDATHFRLTQQPDRNFNYELNILKAEIEKLESEVHFTPGKYTKLLTANNLNDKLRRAIQLHIDSIGHELNHLRTQAAKKRDMQYKKQAELLGRDKIFNLKKSALNTSLDEWVKNKRSGEQITEGNGGFIRKKDPIYYIPESRIGRAHFYAPIKRLGNLKIETLWFNIGAIWLMSAILYYTLTFNLLYKLVNYFERKKLRKTN